MDNIINKNIQKMQLIKYKNVCLGLSVNICWEDRPLKHQMRQLNKAKNMAGFFIFN